jgi:hypothetical protein
MHDEEPELVGAIRPEIVTQRILHRIGAYQNG